MKKKMKLAELKRSVRDYQTKAIELFRLQQSLQAQAKDSEDELARIQKNVQDLLQDKRADLTSPLELVPATFLAKLVGGTLDMLDGPEKIAVLATTAEWARAAGSNIPPFGADPRW